MRTIAQVRECFMLLMFLGFLASSHCAVEASRVARHAGDVQWGLKSWFYTIGTFSELFRNSAAKHAASVLCIEMCGKVNLGIFPGMQNWSRIRVAELTYHNN